MKRLIGVAAGLAAALTVCTIGGAQEIPVEEAEREHRSPFGKVMREVHKTSPEEARRGYYSTHPAIQAKAEQKDADLRARLDPENRHQDAPPWFLGSWIFYEANATGLAVLYLDRNALGVGAVSCPVDCPGIKKPGDRDTAEARFKDLARNYCEEDVRDNFPDATPVCRIYAIGDEIVWEGPMPRAAMRGTSPAPSSALPTRAWGARSFATTSAPASPAPANATTCLLFGTQF